MLSESTHFQTYTWYASCNSAIFFFRLKGNNVELLPSLCCSLIPYYSYMFSCILFWQPLGGDSETCSEAFKVVMWTPHMKPSFPNKLQQDAQKQFLCTSQMLHMRSCLAARGKCNALFMPFCSHPNALQLVLRNLGQLQMCCHRGTRAWSLWPSSGALQLAKGAIVFRMKDCD